MYLTQCLHRGARSHPEAIATIDGDRIRTWRAWHADIARFGGALRALGVQDGDRVAMLSRNSADFVDYIFGTIWAGGAINPVNVRWTPREIAYSLSNCATRVLFVDPAFAGKLDEIRSLAPGLAHVLIVGSVEWQEWLAAATPVEDAGRSGDDLAAVMYTGGTTGFPKGVMLSHRNLVSAALGVIACPEGRTSDSFIHTAPLFHVGALAGLLMAAICGSTSIFVPAFEPLAVLAEIEKRRATEIFLVPTMMRMLIDHPEFSRFDLSSLRRIRYGASPIDLALMDRLLSLFPSMQFSQAYGMTELGPTATSLNPEDHCGAARTDGRMRSAGRATATTEVRIVGPDDQELPVGEVGEIVCRGENVMLGYWGMPEATAEATRNGWMHTGDLGRMDASGYVTVVDRLKDMIVTGGENVYSAEVENALATHPSVAMVAVIALPDPQWGEKVHAVIVPRDGCEILAGELDAHARQILAGYKVPRSFSFVEALPLSAAGKILKHVLRAEAGKEIVGA